MVITVTLFAQTTYYVNDNSTTSDVFTTAIGNNTNFGTAAAPFATLQYAVNQASAGDIIYIDAGSYTGQVTIDKGITIIGAGQNLTFITNTSQLLAPPGPFTEYALIQTTQGIGDVHIRDITATNGTAGDGHTILIQSGGSVKNCKLINGGQSVFFRVPDATVKSALAENNIMDATGIGINCQGSGLTAIIRNNNISRSSGMYSGIFAGLDFGPLPQLIIQNNIIDNYFGDGMLVASFNGTYTSNSITGTGTFAINRNGNGGNTPVATCNWFGSSNAGTVASKISGTVIYSPFLATGTDNSSSVGFQPAAACGTSNTYYVNDGSNAGDIFTTAIGNDTNPGTASAPFATIQNAVNIAAANDIIYVDAGTYTEQVTITKGINITGAGQNLTSVVVPASTVAPPGPFTEQGVIQTAQNIGDVNIKDLSVTGTLTPLTITPIIIQSSGSVRNCKLQNGNQGLFVRIDAATNPGSKTFTIEGNQIDAEYIAVNVEGAGLNATLNNNTLRAFNPGFSVGIFAGMDFGILNSINATNNLFSNYLTSGIWVNANNASITQNAFTGTGASAINKTGGANVTANCNWYGVASASSIIPKVSAGVNYYPWYIDGTDASPAAGFQHWTESCGASANVYYINDNSTTGDIFTTAVGNDANAGTSPTSPLATFAAALTKASPGATIYFDAGTYTAQNVTIGKSVNVIGTNYHVSPNNAANPLLLNSTRNPESIIENSNWQIGADGINFTGLTFNPLSNNAIIINGASFGNFNLSRNRVRISNLFPPFFFNGLSTVTTVSQIVNWGLTISDNRFEKEDATAGVTIRVNRFGSVNIRDNSFVVTGTTPRTQTSMVLGNAGIVAYASVFNNTFDRAGTGIGGNTWNFTNINANKFINTSTAFNINNSYAESADVLFNNNVLDGSEGIVPFVQYTRQGGNAVGAKSSFTAEGNTITGNAVAGTTTLLGSMNLIFNNSVLSPALTVRNNKITYAGDLSSVPAHFIRPIMVRGNLLNTVVEKNEINLTGINQQPKTDGVDLPVSPAITLYTDNGTGSFLQNGSVINILNNKINGFKHSFAAYDPLAGNDAYIGYGNIPAGVTVNINNNSFTGDSISINNGTVGQPVLATCNWYGSADASVVVPKISGIAVYSPWLSNGTDNDVTTGFQPLPNICNGRQNKFYVNDGIQTGDVFTTAVGNDANSGIPSAPLATIAAAITKASAGDTIIVDAGTYAEANLTIVKSVTILGSNYLTNPNDGTNPLNAANRTAETIISNTTWTIGASDIRMKGFTFDPQAKTALAQTNNTLDFDNIEVSNNIFLVTSITTPVNLIGKQQLPLVTFNYSITSNRFIKSVAGNSANIAMAGVDGILISGNTFTTSNAAADWTQNAYFSSTGFRNNNFIISNNVIYRPRFAFQNLNAIKAEVSSNKVLEAIRFLLDFNGLNVPTEVTITDNEVTIANSNGGPAISYSKSNGTDQSAPNIARIERNTITADGTGWSLVPQALVAPTIDNLSANTQVFIRDNKLTITGNFSTQSDPGNYVSAIRFLNNSRQAVVERNEIQFSATNYGTSNKFGIGILYSGLQPGTSFNFLNNKISGFYTSIGVQNNANANNYGELPAGTVLNINNNSFTGDVMSINNGTTGQDASASCNWYGSAAAQDFINKLANVSAVPWLTNGTDNDAATGFQPVDGACDGYPTVITLDGYTNVTCNGAANGTISITTSYGKAPFVYTWTKDVDANFISHDEDLSNLAPGTYHLTIVDGNGSTIYITSVDADGPGTIDVIITEPPLLTATAGGTNVSCNAGNNGTATVTVDGGTPSYTYSWSNGAIDQSISNLTAGMYTVTVTDANGCTTTSAYEVTQPTAITAAVSVVNNTCFNGTAGSITVNASGGTGSLSYSIGGNNYQPGNVFNNLPAGPYTVYVKDENGCIITSDVTITQPTAIFITISNVTNTCTGSNNGAISSNATGGTGILIYNWTGPNGFIKASKNISNLAAGVYNLTVTDANGCIATALTTVAALPAVTTSAIVTDVTCYNTLTGAINLTPGGGSGSFTFSWTGPNGFKASTEDISNLKAGTYSVTITDVVGCSILQSFTVQPATAISVTTVKTDAVCSTGGTVTINVTGGRSPYSYSINGTTFQSSNVFTNVSAGTYNTVTVKDNSGCTAVAASVTIINSDSYEVFSNEKQNSGNLNTTIAFNQSVAARISPTATDKDWYNIKIGSVAGTVTISLTHPSIAYTFNLYDSKGKVVPVSSSTATTKTYTALSGNTVYSIQVSSSTSSVICYTLQVTSTAVPLTARTNAVKQQEVIVANTLSTMVYPNPHHGSFGIRIEALQSGMATVEIMNLAGQRIESRKVAVTKGNNTIVRFTNMHQSALIYRVTMGDEIKTGKILSAN